MKPRQQEGAQWSMTKQERIDAIEFLRKHFPELYYWLVFSIKLSAIEEGEGQTTRLYNYMVEELIKEIELQEEQEQCRLNCIIR